MRRPSPVLATRARCVGRRRHRTGGSVRRWRDAPRVPVCQHDAARQARQQSARRPPCRRPPCRHRDIPRARPGPECPARPAADSPAGCRRAASPPDGGASDRTVGAPHHHAGAASLQREQVHRRRADEAGGETGRRTRIDLGRRRVLLDVAVAQQHDLVGHAHRLGLVVRDVQHGDAQPTLQRQDLAPHVGAKLCIEVRQRFIHQADRRLGDDGAAECHALLLAAGQLAGLALQQMSDAEDLHRARQPARALRLRARGAPSGRTRCSPRRSDAGTSA